MKKIFFLIIILILLVCLCGVALIAPVVLFFLHIPPLPDLAETFQEQIDAFSAFSVVEQDEQTNETTTITFHSITITIVEEDINTLLYDHLSTKRSSFIMVEQVDSNISAETIYIEIDVHYGLFGFHVFDTTLFSEWMVRSSPEASIIELKPVDIHTSYAYTVNLVKVWNIMKRKELSDGWMMLPLASQLQIEDIILQENEIAISIASGL